MDPMAYLAVPVEVVYASDPASSKLSPVDFKNGIVTSGTGELKWNVDAGICTLDAPKAQGVSGFIAGERIDLSSISVLSRNDYITVVAVSADGKNLEESRRVLLQIGTTSRPHGWRTAPDGDGQRITSLGGPPWNVVKADVGLSIRNPFLKRAEVLDTNFLKTREIAITDGKFTVPEDALYLMLVE